MRFLVNPMASIHRHGKPASIKAWRASGFRRNAPKRKSRKRPSAKQLAARKKFAAMARARASAGGTHRARTKPKGTIMARRKRSAAARRSTRRKRHSVARRSYAANPKRRRRVIRHHAKRRRSFRRNPGKMKGMLGDVVTLFKESGVALLGMAAGRTISNLIPIGGTSPLVKFAKGTVVAIGIRMLGEKVIGKDLARIAALGAMLAPTRELVIGYFPTASTFLGGYAGGGVMAMPRIPARSSIGSYAGNMSGFDGNAGLAIGSYATDGY